MDPFRVVNSALALAGVPYRNGVQRLTQTQLGQVGLVDRSARQNLMSIVEGVAMAGGGTFALLSIPGAKKVTQVSLGTLGGGLLLAGMLKIYDGLD